MSRKVLKTYRLFTALFIMFFALGIMLMLPAPVNAASKIPKTISGVFYPGESSSPVSNSWVFPEEIFLRESKCKSSNEKVATIESTETYGGQVKEYYISFHKPGKAKLTVVQKRTGKKDRVYKIQLVVKKYKNPLKVFKIGSKNWTEKYNKKNWAATMNKKPLKGKLVVKPASGWRVVKIKACSPVVENGYVTWENKVLKSGKTIDIRWRGTLEVKVQNKKTKKYETLKLEAGYAY